MIKEIIKKHWPQKARRYLQLFRSVIILSMERLFFKKRVRSSIRGGFPLKVYIADSTAERWYGHDSDKLSPEMFFLKQYKLKSGARVFNIGAHQCVVALVIGKIVGEDGLVVCVEADAHNVKIAKINKKINNAKQLHIIHAAGAEKAGTLFFDRDPRGQVVNKDELQLKAKVLAITIDDLTERYSSPSVLYIDVEGYECNVLRGATKTLQYCPDCFIEVHVGSGLEKFGGSVSKLVSFFPRDRYRLFMVSEQTCNEVIPFDINNNLINSRFFLIAVSSAGDIHDK